MTEKENTETIKRAPTTIDDFAEELGLILDFIFF